MGRVEPGGVGETLARRAGCGLVDLGFLEGAVQDLLDLGARGLERCGVRLDDRRFVSRPRRRQRDAAPHDSRADDDDAAYGTFRHAIPPGHTRWIRFRSMVYDGGLMRSILALGLALLVLASEAPGIFIESPVCAAVDGRSAAPRKARAPAAAKSCCGSASCPMHAAQSCGKAETCPMSAPARPATATGASKTPGEAGPNLCAPSCGRERARVVPCVPDPGTLDLSRAPATPLSQARVIHSGPRDLPSQIPAPADPPPRS